MSRSGLSSTSTPSELDSGRAREVRSLAQTFWRALCRKRENVAKEALRGLAALKTKDSAFSFDDDYSMVAGTPVGELIPPDTPKNARDALNSDVEVHLLLLDPDVHCRGRIGGGKGALFIACAMNRVGSDACLTVAHRDANCDRMFIPGTAWAILL